MPAKILLPQPAWPYVLRDETQSTASYFAISVVDPGWQEGEERFYVLNGNLTRSIARRGSSDWDLELLHSFAVDDEGDPCVLAEFLLRGLELTYAGAHRVTWAGTLSQVYFYPRGYVAADGTLLNPFGALASDRDLPEDHGLPSMPPEVRLGDALVLPAEVEVSLHYGQSGADVEDWFRRIEASAGAR